MPTILLKVLLFREFYSLNFMGQEPTRGKSTPRTPRFTPTEAMVIVFPKFNFKALFCLD